MSICVLDIAVTQSDPTELVWMCYCISKGSVMTSASLPGWDCFDAHKTIMFQGRFWIIAVSFMSLTD